MGGKTPDLRSGSLMVSPPAMLARLASGEVEMVEPDFAHQSQWVYVRAGEFTFGVITELDAAIAGASALGEQDDGLTGLEPLQNGL